MSVEYNSIQNLVRYSVYAKNSIVAKQYTFSDNEGKPQDPDSVTMEIKSPTEETLIVTKVPKTEIGQETFSITIPSNAPAGLWMLQMTAIHDLKSQTETEYFIVE